MLFDNSFCNRKGNIINIIILYLIRNILFIPFIQPLNIEYESLINPFHAEFEYLTYLFLTLNVELFMGQSYEIIKLQTSLTTNDLSDVALNY